MASFRRSKKARQSEVDGLRTEIRRLTDLITELKSSQSTTASHVDDISERLGRLDARVAQVGHEVTHQLGELSGDIDALGRRADTLNDEIARLGELPETVDEVRADQARLANEQARYEIAFRQDLAEIVDQFQRKRPSA